MKIIETFVVNKAPTEVFDYIAVNYFDNHTKFDPEVREMIWRTSPPVAKGTKGTEKRSFAGLPVFLKFEVTEFDKPKYFAFKNTSGPFQLERSYTIKPTRTGTQVTFVFDMAPKNWLMRPVFSLLKTNSSRNVKHNIGLLRSQLET